MHTLAVLLAVAAMPVAAVDTGDAGNGSQRQGQDRLTPAGQHRLADGDEVPGLLWAPLEARHFDLYKYYRQAFDDPSTGAAQPADSLPAFAPAPVNDSMPASHDGCVTPVWRSEN